MKIWISANSTNNEIHTFKVTFENDSPTPQILPLTQIRASAERIGLKVALGDMKLEPIEKVIVNLIDKKKDDVILAQGEIEELILSANIVKLGKTALGLKFRNATYLVEPELDYSVYFSWDQYKSNTIAWSFNAL